MNFYSRFRREHFSMLITIAFLAAGLFLFKRPGFLGHLGFGFLANVFAYIFLDARNHFNAGYREGSISRIQERVENPENLNDAFDRLGYSLSALTQAIGSNNQPMEQVERDLQAMMVKHKVKTTITVKTEEPKPLQIIDIEAILKPQPRKRRDDLI
jgi:hypothetical protein